MVRVQRVMIRGHTLHGMLLAHTRTHARVNRYQDVIDGGGISHASPLPPAFQRVARRGYYAAITNVDIQVGRLLDSLADLGVADDTAVVLTADHAQNLGEGNMWSMMNLMETSLRIPLIIRPAASDRRFHRGGGPPAASVYPHMVELVDLFPTVAALAGLAPPPGTWQLDGDNLVPGMLTGGVVKRVNAAFGQITRCMNCTVSYTTNADTYQAGCAEDGVDAGRWYVPCAHTNRTDFDLMGMSIRTDNWRYSVFCRYARALQSVECEWVGGHGLRISLYFKVDLLLALPVSGSIIRAVVSPYEHTSSHTLGLPG
jgi:hypothetical protein